MGKYVSTLARAQLHILNTVRSWSIADHLKFTGCPFIKINYTFKRENCFFFGYLSKDQFHTFLCSKHKTVIISRLLFRINIALSANQNVALLLCRRINEELPAIAQHVKFQHFHMVRYHVKKVSGQCFLRSMSSSKLSAIGDPCKNVIHNNLCRCSKFLTTFSVELFFDQFKGEKKKWRLELAKKVNFKSPARNRF